MLCCCIIKNYLFYYVLVLIFYLIKKNFKQKEDEEDKGPVGQLSGPLESSSARKVGFLRGFLPTSPRRAPWVAFSSLRGGSRIEICYNDYFLIRRR